VLLYSDVETSTTNEIKRWRAAKGRQQVRLERRALVEGGSTSLAWRWSENISTHVYRLNNIGTFMRIASAPKRFWQKISQFGSTTLELKETTGDVTAVRLSTTVEASICDAFEFLKDLNNRKLWDKTFTDAKVMLPVGDEDDIVWQAMGDRDFCLLRSWTVNATPDASSDFNLSRYAIASHSVIHNSTPPNVKSFTRAEVDSSGFLLEPLRMENGSFDSDSSQFSLTYVAQIGANALRLVIGEIYQRPSDALNADPSKLPPIMASFVALREVLASRYQHKDA
jgi:hypothetical protein